MKLTKTIVTMLALSASFSFAATTIYKVQTGTTATSNGIANSAGLQFQSASVAAFASAGPGVISFGYFTVSDATLAAATMPSDLTSVFNNWMNATTTFNSPALSQTRGVFAATAIGRTIDSDFAGKNMYVFVGNNTTYANSTEFLILKTTFTFNTADSGPTPFTNTITTANSAPVTNGLASGDPLYRSLGTVVSDVRTTGTDVSVTPGWQTAVLVPETSTALLGALGALGLLRRRR
ncbi:MAG: hypothetical protein NTW21_22245 [Verrucomicrobia bacterium]|nr:hypothetical protein [Verrucomicrobiota bacterium]